MDDIPTTTVILTGVERSAIERLMTARDIVMAADLFLDETRPDDADEQQGNALIAIAVLEPLIVRLATTLVASATKRPGGAAKLSRAVRDLQQAVQDIGAFPDTHRMANVDDGRADIEDMLDDLLSNIALENHDIDLTYETNASGDHVIEWRELPTHIADVGLMRGLEHRMDEMLMSDPRTSFEHAAALQWFIANMPAPDDDDEGDGSAEQRMMEWALLDRIVPELGSSAAATFPLDATWRMLTPRHQRLARALAESVPGLFVIRGATTESARVEDAIDGATYEVIIGVPVPAADEDVDLLYLGRLVPYEGKTYVLSPGTALFELSRGSARLIRAATKNARLERADRALIAEEFIRRGLGWVTPAPATPDLSAVEARELLASYGAAPKGDASSPPDLLTRDWMATLREIASREPEPPDLIEA